MRRWMADVTGLLIGTAIGAGVLAVFWPELQAMGGAHAVAPAAIAAATVPQDPMPVVHYPVAPSRGIAMAPPAPAPLPAVIPAPLPSVVHPGSPPVAPPHVAPAHIAPGTAYAGTGFFIAFDGTLLTAAHVVAGCTRAQIVSAHVPLTAAIVLARDTLRDIALLRAAQAQPAAVLPVGHPAASGRVLVLGYPARAGLLVPEEEWADLRSGLVQKAGAMLAGRDGVWLETTRITHGYSGGPVIDPRTGMVVAIVRAEVTGPGVQALIGRSGAHMATGPAGEGVTGFLRQEAPWIDPGLVRSGGEDTIAAARLATIHVICSR